MTDPSHTHTVPSRGLINRRTFLAGTAGATVLAGLAGKGFQRPASAAPAIPAADRDPLDLLQRMLRFDTQNFGEGGQTLEHAKMLKAVWDNAGVEAEIVPTPMAGNVHLIARVKGTGTEKPLLLLGHSDVVPVEKENWSVDPFAAEVVDGEIFGRGALDMKGANAAFVAALLRHLSEGHQFDRDIVVLTDADEEAGPHGSNWLVKERPELLEASMVLTEGGWFLAQSDGTTPMLTSMTRQDKLYFNLDLVAKGTATHSSKPIPDAAIVRLSRAVDKLGDWKGKVTLTDVTREYFAALAGASSNKRFARAIELMLRERGGQDLLERHAAMVVKESDYPYLHEALLRTTHSFVIADAGYKENVIPSTATCRVNCRGIPGGQKPREVYAEIKALLADSDVEVRPIRADDKTEEEHWAELDAEWATAPAAVDNKLVEGFRSATTARYPGAKFTPALFEAGTSLDPWRKKGIPGYGVYPYVIDNDQLIGMHGNDERIATAALATGTDFMYDVFAKFVV